MNPSKESLEQNRANERKQYRCFCRKCYSSYAGLYLHLKSKHQQAFSKYKNMKISKLLIPVENQGRKYAYRLKQPPQDQNQEKTKTLQNAQKAETKQSKPQEEIRNRSPAVQSYPLPSQDGHLFFPNSVQNGAYDPYFFGGNPTYQNPVSEVGILGMNPNVIFQPSIQSYQYPFGYRPAQQQSMYGFPQNFNIQNMYTSNNLNFYPNFPMYQPLAFQNMRDRPTYQVYTSQNPALCARQKQLLTKPAQIPRNSQKQTGRREEKTIYSSQEYMRKMVSSNNNQQTSDSKGGLNLN